MVDGGCDARFLSMRNGFPVGTASLLTVVGADPRDHRQCRIAAVQVRRHPRVRAPAATGRIRPAAGGIGGARRVPPLHPGAAQGGGHRRARAGVRRHDARRPHADDQRHRDDPGRRADRIALATHYDTKLFREFRFVGASDGASSTAAVLELARVLKARQNEFTIELLFFDGEEAVVEWRDNDNTYGSRHYVQAAQQGGDARRAQGARPARHDRRPGPDHPARRELDAVADRHRLGVGREARPPRDVPRRLHHDRRRPHAVRRAPACPPSTSSTSTTPRGTRRRTISTTSARAACRSSATSCSTRCRRSRNGSPCRRAAPASARRV